MCFIVPAHVYNNILEKGNAEQKSFAANVLESIKGFAHGRQCALHVNVAKGLNSLGVQASDTAIARTLHDAEHKMTLPGKVVRNEGEASKGDVSVDEAYDGSGKTHAFFKDIFGRNSIDDRGMALISTVHFGKNFGNAFWNGSQMTYGDGDGKIFNRFTSVIDVIGHELAHGVTEHTAGLVYSHQSGALNEHFSDVFGSMVKQRDKNHQSKDADWLIGEGLFTDKIDGVALRSMKAPGTAYDDEKIGKDPQPDHMRKYNKTESDNGGVHINSGIPNKAFYETAMMLGGYAWEKAGRIWYDTLCTELNSRSQFKDCAKATFKVAEKLYGKNSVEQKAVKEGWKKVGITVGGGIWSNRAR
jgi:Zn-dependent metalloprotease